MRSRPRTQFARPRAGCVVSSMVMVTVMGGALAACGTGSASEASRTSPPAGTSPGEPDPSTTSSAPVPTSTATTQGPAGTSIIAADSQFGDVLFDSTGQAVYVFDVETSSKPACYDDCAEAWPPVLTEGRPVAGPGAEAGLLGTTTRTGGAIQVTYKGQPLYFYAHEGKHEVKCHDIFLNGGNWYAVQPDGSGAPKT